jgi:hypothetical protein
VPSGIPFDVTVTAQDPYGNTDTNYTGTVTFSSSDLDPGVMLPGDYTFQASDGGVVTFPGGVTLITQGNQTLTAVDTISGINGTANITVTSGDSRPGTRVGAVVFTPDTRVAIGSIRGPTAWEAPWASYWNESDARQANALWPPPASAVLERPVGVVHEPTSSLTATVPSAIDSLPPAW